MSEPIVAIIGRPNVGKSTLFNRLTGSRDAITDDSPGITRDRHYGHVAWNGRHFTLIDTGGYLPESSEMFDAAIKEQVEMAMDEADLLLFLQDAQTGITETDEQIAQMLRRGQHNLMVLVNKVDKMEQEVEVSEFYALGLGDPYPVSAMIGRNSGDVLDAITDRLRKVAVPDKDFEGIKLAIIGRENVGKSSLVNTLLDQNRSIVTNVPGTTRDAVDSELKYHKRNYLLIDTAGLKRKARVKENVLFYSSLRTIRSIQKADVVIYMVDINEGLSKQDVQVLNDAANQYKGIVLLLNKWDLVEKDHLTTNALKQDILDRLGVLRYIPMMFVSVHNKQRLYKALDLATEVYENRKKVIPTSELNTYFSEVIRANMPPAVKGKEIKINYITQIRTYFPLFAFFSNHPNLITENYKRFLENKLRERYGFEGVPVIISFRKKNTRVFAE